VEEAKRLDAQHDLLKEVFDNRILFAPVIFSGDDAVLDNGTGTGIWITDLRQNLPASVSLYGVDLHTRLVPSNPPVNTTFLPISFLDLPAEWANKFTLVNQRLMIAALTRENWKQDIREIHRVLKPGGWAQFLEISGRVDAPEGETDEHADWFTKIVAALTGHVGLVQECYKDIPGLLRDAGFSNVVVEERRVKLGKGNGLVGERMLHNMAGIFEGFKAPILKAGGFSMVSSDSEYDTRVAGLVERCNAREGIETGWYVIYAQK